MALSCSQIICSFFHLCKLFITYNYTKYPILNIFLKTTYCYNKISLYPRARNKSVLRTPCESINFRAQLLFRARICVSRTAKNSSGTARFFLTGAGTLIHFMLAEQQFPSDAPCSAGHLSDPFHVITLPQSLPCRSATFLSPPESQTLP